jgi:hypothetical protein
MCAQKTDASAITTASNTAVHNGFRVSNRLLAVGISETQAEVCVVERSRSFIGYLDK